MDHSRPDNRGSARAICCSAQARSFKRPSGRNTASAPWAIFQPASDRSYCPKAASAFFQAQRAATATPRASWPCRCACSTRRVAASACSQRRSTWLQLWRNTRRASWVVWNTSRPFSNGGCPVLSPLLLHGGDPRLQARPRVRRDELQRGPVAQRLRPGRPRAVVGLLPEEPGHAGRLDAHQHGAAVEEDLIEAADQDQRPAPRIEGLQDASRRQPCGLDPAVHRGATGAGLLAQEQGQQDEDLVEAQSHRRGGDGELLAAWLGGNSMVWASQSQSWAFSRRRC